MPASASASSAPSPTSRAFPTCATQSPSRERPETRSINDSEAGLQLLLSQSRRSSYLRYMTKLLEQAIEAVRQLPADSQDEIARAILHLAGSEVEAELVDPTHLT